MSVALPNPWVDTGITKSPVISCNAALVLWTSGTHNEVNFQGGAFLGHWRLYSDLFIDISGFPNDVAHFKLMLSQPDVLGTPATLEDHSAAFHAGDPLPAAPTSGTNTFGETSGPFRLGMRYRKDTTNIPGFGPRDYLLEYAWFADESTAYVQTLAGYSVTLYHLTGTTTPPSAGATPVIVGGQIGRLHFNGNVILRSGGDPPTVLLRAMTLDGGSVDTSELDTGVIKGNGAGNIDGYATGSYDRIAAPPFTPTYDCRISQNGTTANNWARVTDGLVTSGTHHGSPPAYLTFPTDNGAKLVLCDNWTTTALHTGATSFDPLLFSQLGVSFQLQVAWEAAQDPALDDSDRWVPIRGCERTNPTTRGPYTPVTLVIASSVDIHRPDGNRPSDWVAQDGNCVVTEHATTTDVVCSGASAGVKRTLLASWRHWIDPMDGAYTVDGYRRLRHASGEDVFWTSTYAYLKVRITAPTSASLSLKVDFTHLEVTIPGSTPYTQHTGNATYNFNVTAGANTVYLDLLFPAGGAETYIGRVDAWTLSGFAAHASAYTITGLDLVARNDLAAPGGQAAVKHAMGVPIAGGDYSVPTIALDGSWVFGNVGDQVDKPDEVGQYGGSPRYVTPAADQALLVDYWTAAGQVGLDQIEGIAVTYSASAYHTAWRDAFSVDLAPENADWLEPVVPMVRVAAASNWQPNVTPNCRELRITNCQAYKVYVDHPLWGSIESVVKAGSGRAAAGVVMNGVRTDTGGVAGTGTTDLLGYIIVPTVPANGSRQYKLQQA